METHKLKEILSVLGKYRGVLPDEVLDKMDEIICLDSCEHEWEYSDKVKYCTFEDCGVTKELTKEDVAWLALEEDGGNDF